MLDRYFRCFLKERGLTDVQNVYYSLGYCQGDGVCFSAKLRPKELRGVAQNIYSYSGNNAYERIKNLITLYKTTQVLTYNDESLVLGITHTGSYCHEGNMNCDWDCDWGSIDEDEETYERLTEDILVYAKEIAREMAQKGYGIIESINSDRKEVWRFKTSRYIFRLREIEEELSDSQSLFDDDDCFMNYCNSLINGTTKITCLQGEVYERSDLVDDEINFIEPLDEVRLGSVDYAPGDRSYSSNRREIIGELISRLRDEDAEPFNIAA